jgi:phosphoribosylformimino-5-aminoimidazole carboxamide ribotide isomerase
MIILPAIDIKDKTCVRLFQGDYSTATKVADDPITTAQSFEEAGARWLHMVDLDGAKAKVPVNSEVILGVKDSTNMHIEIGGGIRDMDTVDFYLENGISRVILGSAALHDPDFVKEAVKKYGKKIAVGIDALAGKVAAEGWTATSKIDYIDMAKAMEDIGVQYIIFTDISKDGTLDGPNLTQLDKINRSVSSNIIASGGVSTMKDILDLYDLGVYGTIAGKSLYSKRLDLRSAVVACQRISGSKHKNMTGLEDELERYFVKSELIPAIIQEESTGEVLMLAYMNRESMAKTMETGYTWFYSRSRKELWNKGSTSGHLQKVLSIDSDCDDDTLLIKVIQTGAACHTGKHSCFFKKIV